jgi:Polyketide cyclase / dehydrase and lipid transport
MPIVIESVREAAVAPRDVFALYADPTTWSTWGHNARWARSDGPLVEGGTVEVKAGYGATYRCRIRRLEQDRALELEVRPVGLFIVNVYEVEPTERGARVRHALEFSGPLARPTRWLGVHRLYRKWLGKEVTAVIELAAARADAGAA